MHIPDGIVSMPVLVAGGVVGGAAIAYGLRRMSNDDVPKAAVLTAAFFVTSLIHIPLGPASVHLLLPGLMGMLLGWSVFPAVFTGILMQYLMFGHGGITTLGVNTVILATPGVICYLLFDRFTGRSRKAAFNSGFVAGALGVLFSCLMFAGFLVFSGKEFQTISMASMAIHLPIACIEGLVTAAAMSFIFQVRPHSLPSFQRSAEPILDEVA